MVAKTAAVKRAEQPVALDRTVQRALRELRALRAQADELEAKIKAKTKIVKDAMGDHEEATVGGRVVATWKVSIRQGLDQTKLKENYPDAVLACTKQTAVRTFKLIEDA